MCYLFVGEKKYYSISFYQPYSNSVAKETLEMRESLAYDY